MNDKPDTGAPHKNRFDAALQPGIREAMRVANQTLRRAEAAEFNQLLDVHGEFLPGAAYPRDCPFCGTASSAASPVLHAHGMHLLRCPECSFVYSREVINQASDRERYADSSAADANVALKQNPVYAKLEREKARYVAFRLGEQKVPGKVLDIGCSTGAFLDSAASLGWQTHGIELNPRAAEVCLANGHAVRCGEYPEALPSDWGKFDAISLMDVLEHVPEPIAFLRGLGEHLRPDGVLLIQVPNLNSLLLAIEGSANSNFCHGHWSYFTAQTLQASLVKAGFEAGFFETYITELDRALSYPATRVRETWFQLTGELLDDAASLTVERLHAHMLGYKLFGIFRKVI